MVIFSFSRLVDAGINQLRRCLGSGKRKRITRNKKWKGENFKQKFWLSNLLSDRINLHQHATPRVTCGSCTGYLARHWKVLYTTSFFTTTIQPITAVVVYGRVYWAGPVQVGNIHLLLDHYYLNWAMVVLNIKKF